MKRWRYLAHGPTGAADGLATDEAILLRYRARCAGDDDGTLRLYSYRPHCALIGRYQSVEDEIDTAFCAAHGVRISRRPTGGGAIIMGPDQLAVAVAMRADGDLPPRELLRRFADGVIDGLARLGVAAALRGKNDLVVSGRKIAGLGLYLDGHGAVLFHASVLLDLDTPLMLRVLRIPGASLSDEGVRRIEDRLTTMSRELGRALSVDDVRGVFLNGFGQALGVGFTPGTLAAAEIQRRDVLIGERYASRGWIHRRDPRGEARGSARLETPVGLLRVHVGLHGNVIKSALFCGDFNVAPPVLTRLEAELRWCRPEPRKLERLASRFVAPDDLDVEPARIADLVWRAVCDARPAATPARLFGSCYASETMRVTRLRGAGEDR